MRIIAKSNITAFAAKHPEAAAGLNSWYFRTVSADWRSMNDVLGDFPKAKALNGERARFEIGGGNYRLIASFNFSLKLVWVKFIGTHKEYDRVDVFTVSQF